ncbi:hypothetical protein BH11BAC3_BH11BAC3_14720 [soil metagenome]
MIKLLKYTCIVLSGAMLMASCKKNNVVLDRDPLTHPEAARFLMVPTASNNYYAYNILAIPSPGSVFNIPVGVTTVSNVDRKVKFTYSSRTAVAGTQYTAPSEITIKAGKSLDTLQIQGLFAGYPTGRIDTLKIKITSESGYIDKNAYQDSVLLIMKKTCPVVASDFAGDFKVVVDEWADYFPGDIVPLTVSGDTVMFKYLAGNATPIKIVLNKANSSTSVAKQTYGFYGPDQFSVQSVASTDNFVNPCDLIISVRLTHTVAAGSYGSYTIKFQKP